MVDTGDFDILILEDETFICGLLELALSEIDAELRTAHDCTTAMQLAKEKRPDLAILDIGLPDGDGREFARELRRIYDTPESTIPVVFLTGRHDQNTRVEAYLAEAIDYITKPFSIMEISMKLRNLVNLIKSQRGNVSTLSKPASQVHDKRTELHKAVLDLCENNCDNEDFSIAEAARLLGVSTRTLQRRLSSNFNTSFSEILQNTRMERAKIYLKNDYSIKETSRACGYRHVENFSTAFVRTNKITPKEFRNSMGAEFAFKGKRPGGEATTA